MNKKPKSYTPADVVRFFNSTLLLFFFGIIAMADVSADSSMFLKLMKVIAIFPFFILIKKIVNKNVQIYDSEDEYSVENAFLFHICSFVVILLIIFIIAHCFGWVSNDPIFQNLSKILLMAGLIINLVINLPKNLVQELKE